MRLLLVLLVSSAALSAQTAAPAVSATTRAQDRLQQQAAATSVTLLGSASAGCPVAFSARRASDGALVQTGKRPAAHKLEYDVSFGTGVHQPSHLTEARITLHGLDGARVVPAAAEGAGSATEAFTLQPTSQQDHSFHSVVYAHKLTGVQTIELNELTYADGTHWHESAADPCRISPNGFTLIGAVGR